MDRRYDERYPARLEVILTDLAKRNSAAGFVTDISESGVCVVTSLDLPAGAVVKLEMADSVLFGHAVYSNAERESFRAGIEIARVLLGGTDASHLLHSVLMEAMPSTPGV